MKDTTNKQKTQQEYWNARARTFPRFEEGEQTYEAGMLRRILDAGVDFSGKSVLDVGSGSGMYTLRLARMAQSVTAMDVSDEMLRLLQEDAATMGINNIVTVHSGWNDFDANHRFDIVFASMTPAIDSDESREKLMRFASGWIVFMGFAKRMPSNIMQGLYKHYSITPKAFSDAQDMRRWLDAKGIAYTGIPVAGQWTTPKSEKDIVDLCLTTLRGYGVDPDPDFIAAYIEAFKDQDGQYVERTEYSIEIILWQSR